MDRENHPPLLLVNGRKRDADRVVGNPAESIVSFPLQNPLFVATMLAGHGDAIGTLVAALAMPLPPVATLAAHLTVPGAAILYHAVPAEGIPIAFTAFRTKIHAQQLL